MMRRKTFYLEYHENDVPEVRPKPQHCGGVRYSPLIDRSPRRAPERHNKDIHVVRRRSIACLGNEDQSVGPALENAGTEDGA